MIIVPMLENSYAAVERGRLLLKQSRYELAEKELRRAVSAQPKNSTAHSLLALCLSAQGKRQRAIEEAQTAIGLTPYDCFGHFALGSILFDQDRLNQAEEAVHEAIRLNPQHPDHFVLLGNIRMRQAREDIIHGRTKNAQAKLDDALELAMNGLSLDPHHIGCITLQAIALHNQRRRKEAESIINRALSINPEDAFAHTMRGWLLFELGRYQEAMTNFREALRLNPRFGWAQEGIVAALKTRHWIYRLSARFFSWMSLRPLLGSLILNGFVLTGCVAACKLQTMSQLSPELAMVIRLILSVTVVQSEAES